MEANPETHEVIEPNTLTPSQLPNLDVIKKEMIVEENPTSKLDHYDDYDFEPFHENIFRTLSANLDNTKVIDQVKEAYEKLENCFIKNNILTKNGTSKINLKGPDSSIVFLKYKDIDDAFMDMVISENNFKNSNYSPKKIDLKPFKDSFFSINVNDELPLDDESQSKIGDSDTEGVEQFETYIECSETENYDSDGEIAAFDAVSDTLESNDFSLNSQTLGIDTYLECDIKNEQLTQSWPQIEIECKPDLEFLSNIENPRDTSLKETVRDVRVVIEKLPSDVPEQEITEISDDELTFQMEPSPTEVHKTSRQVARKKTGGTVNNNNNNSFTSLSSLTNDNSTVDQKIIHEISNKDDFVPNVFDKMTRAGKRDLERVLKESTANLVVQKTTRLISEKFKELNSDVKELDSSSSEDEEKDLDIQKTAEILTSTILNLLTKAKSKKLEKLGKEITEEIANKISNFKFSTDDSHSESQPQTVEEPTSTETLASNTGQCDNLTSLPIDITEKNSEEKLPKPCDKIEENIPRRVTRESYRLSSQKKNSIGKSPAESGRKTLAEQFEEIERVERDIVNCELSASLNDEGTDEPRRPETRLSRQKQNENVKDITEDIINPVVKKPSSKSKKKSTSKSRRKVSSSSRRSLRSTSYENIEPMKCGPLIDGQFLIDTEFNENSVLSMSDSDLSKSFGDNDSFSLAEHIILKASADSTTCENGINTSVISCPTEENLLLSTKHDAEITNTEKEIVMSGMKKVSCEDVNSQTDDNRSGEENQSEFLKETNLNQSSLDENLVSDVNYSGLIRVKDLGKNDEFIENKENVEVQNVSTSAKDKLESESVKVKLILGRQSPKEEQENTGLDQPSISLCDVSISSNFQEIGNRAENKETKKSKPLAVNDESDQSVNEPFKVLNDMITDIEKNLLKEETSPKEIVDVDTSSKTDSIHNHDDTVTSQDDIKKSVSHSAEVSADSSSFLNYTVDDSLRLMIDEDPPSDDLTEKDMELDTSFESIGNDDDTEGDRKSKLEKNETVKVDDTEVIRDDLTEKDMELDTSFESIGNDDDTEGDSKCKLEKKETDNVSKTEMVSDESIKKAYKPAEVNSIGKPLTNEEKIAQLTKRDPRLINDKKIVNVLMRDPRIRNKIPKKEEECEKPLGHEVLDDNPHSPDRDHGKKSKPVPIIPCEEKVVVLQESTKSDLMEPDIDSSKRKKPNQTKLNPKKKVDEELLYKTPLSDLHETNNDQPTYERNKRRNVPAGKRGKLEEEAVRSHAPRRHRAQEELNGEGSSYSHNHRRPENSNEKFFNHESHEDRNFKPSNSEEGNSRSEGPYYGRKFESRHFNQEEREFYSGPRDIYEPESYARRNRYEENLASRNRNELPDNIYSRREFFRRNKHTHDHDHFSNSSRLVENRQENQFYTQQKTFGAPEDSVFCSSSYPPTPLLPDPMYSQEEDFDQSYGNMETDSFSPPSSDLCPPPPSIRTPSPELFRRDKYCPSPPRIGRSESPVEREYDEYNRNFHRNYDREERVFRGKGMFIRDNVGGSSRGFRGGKNSWRGKGRDYRRNDESPPRKRFISDYPRGRDERAGRWRKSPSWSPEVLRRWSRERSLSPPLSHEARSWGSPSPPRWQDNYRERNPPYRNHQRYN